MQIENILVTGKIYKKLEALISGRSLNKQFRYLSEEDVTSDDLNWADALVCVHPFPSFHFGNLKWIHSLNAGVDRFMSEVEWKDDVLFTRTISSFGERMGEFCLSYILQDLQMHEHFSEKQKEESWEPATPGQLKDQSIVIFGTGAIGQKIAEVFSTFGSKVSGVSLSGKSKDPFQQVVSIDNRDQLNNVLQNADWVISTLPNTAETENLFDKSIFSNFDDVGFMNTGRGATVDEGALLKAIDQNHVRKAILDVFREEPLPKDSPFWNHEKVIVTPHISAVTTAEDAVECFVDTLDNIENDRPLENQVDMVKGY
ncbi:D-2-hydroxyacid dehydrogenase [Pontibacillus marinus]|uniref:Hydroxyacid dehydrogenase n=1 Tax=Pontibacillus marinus BH030004 = DSM 16465 TaxID=1385511 RepID=A0A0A5GEK6_9BACI|nr:D-2-hydroxyacid dehydrogenase [Pontibacillus marinus]KGX89648.1 hydroxyacid dehydrogenase [Pontibacillus marinus BH030004 = DSM 16465]